MRNGLDQGLGIGVRRRGEHALAIALLDNLADPVVQEGLAWQEDNRTLLEPFITAETLPDPLTDAFLQAVRDVLEGLHKVDLPLEQIYRALLQGGSPTTVGELKSRFTALVDHAVAGQEPRKVRIVVTRQED